MQNQTQKEVQEILAFLAKWKVDKSQPLLKDMHRNYSKWVIHQLGEYIIHFHNAQPWLHFYVVHCLNMMGTPLEQ